MTWHAISNGRRALRQPDPSDAAKLLPRGTVMVEVPFLASGTERQHVVTLAGATPWPHRFQISLGGDGTALLQHQQGPSIIATLARFPVPDTGELLRISVSWHAPERVGLLVVENLKTGAQVLKVIEEPLPWTLGCAARLMSKTTKLDPNVTLLAVSDGVAPVGLYGGLTPETLIDTPRGPVPVSQLQPHDEVQTSAHGVQPIRQVINYEVPAVGQFAPIHLRAPFFGLARDLTVAPDHRLLVSGSDAEYLFGTEEVLIEARYLARFAATPTQPQAPTQRYYHVLLDAHVCLSVGGAWGESLFLADLADQPMRHAASVMRDTPARLLPRHTRIAGTQLRGYEAAVLVSALCA